MAPTPAAPYGSSQLVVVNSNFDLRYDESIGRHGAGRRPRPVAGHRRWAAQLTRAGIGPHRELRRRGRPGRRAHASPAGPTARAPCPRSRDRSLRRRPEGRSSSSPRAPARPSTGCRWRPTARSPCGAGCPFVLPIQRLDPYGVSIACSDAGPAPSRLRLRLPPPGGQQPGLALPREPAGRRRRARPRARSRTRPTPRSTTRRDDLVFVSTIVGRQRHSSAGSTRSSPLRRERLRRSPTSAAASFSSFLPGAVARDMALSSDGRLLYVSVQLYDLTLALQTGAVFTQGGALAVFDLSPTAFAEPRMALLGRGADLPRVRAKSGGFRPAPGKPDLFAITCDRRGRSPSSTPARTPWSATSASTPYTGLPGARAAVPFGLAVEPIDPGRATDPGARGPATSRRPALPARDCQRIYVGELPRQLGERPRARPRSAEPGGAREAHREGSVKRIVLVLPRLHLLASACSSGSPIIPAGFRGPGGGRSLRGA